jgi:four helix bundle protein
MRDFRTLDLAVEFHHQVAQLRAPAFLKQQMDRASASVALNLAEGRGRPTRRDQLRFFGIAMGSARECQTALRLVRGADPRVVDLADHLCASLHRLIKHAR